MSAEHPLGHRHRHAFERLRQDVIALRAMPQGRRPAASIGDYSMNLLKDTVTRANRVFRREPGMPRFRGIDRGYPLSHADFAILVGRLSSAVQIFAERHPDPDEDDDWFDDDWFDDED